MNRVASRRVVLAAVLGLVGCTGPRDTLCDEQRAEPPNLPLARYVENATSDRGIAVLTGEVYVR